MGLDCVALIERWSQHGGHMCSSVAVNERMANQIVGDRALLK